jgi:2-polyprenyl-6-methoxyphenol hydroxylase-like FAD-dependent oxidoreductase
VSDSPILIAGAGPTGLVLALALARRGIPIRLIAEAPGPGAHSRAMAVHARTLEFYRQFGFADEVVAEGVVADAVHLREVDAEGTGIDVTTFRFDDLGGGISPYPFVLTYAQDLHERFLIGKLAGLGVQPEWNTRLEAVELTLGSALARLRLPDGRAEAMRASYVAGCDGAHSQVRHSLGIGFAGGTYDQLFHVADVRLEGPFDHELQANLGPRILELVMPVRATGMSRLIGLVPPHLSSRSDLTFDDVRGHIETLIGRRVMEVNWFSAYRVHHRVADHFRVGRAFLAGDAGHVHSPAGGQGMNTGIGDAVNLGWKLAQVWLGRAPDNLLDSYETERIGFARRLVATTDRAFRPMVAPGLGGEAMRRLVAPVLASIASHLAFARRALFRAVSQTEIHYPDSALSRGRAGDVRGGDRLPWIADPDNFAPLRSLDWQVHVFAAPDAATRGEASRDDALRDEALRPLCVQAGLPVHALPWTPAAASAGFVQDGVYLVRPDGHVAVAAAGDAAATGIETFLRETGLQGTIMPAVAARRRAHR